MSIKGEPGDAIAKNYKKLLAQGEGGVFISLSGMGFEILQQRLTKKEISHNVIQTKNWTYITFPKVSSLAHFFFIDYKVEFKDDTAIQSHPNKTFGIKEVYVEGDEKVLMFLKIIGLKSLGSKSGTTYGKVTEFETPTGNISVVPIKTNSERYRIRTIVFCESNGSETIRVSF